MVSGNLSTESVGSGMYRKRNNSVGKEDLLSSIQIILKGKKNKIFLLFFFYIAKYI